MYYGDFTLLFTLTLYNFDFFSLNTTLAKYFLEMLKIPRTKLNEIMNSVNFITDIENVTNCKTFLL